MKQPELGRRDELVVQDAEPSSAESGKGLGLAYVFLNKRERTVAEVRSRLDRAGIPAEEIDEVITELLEFGYLDDARYARVFTQDKRTLEAWGSERIARALQERGVERELIEAALVRDQAEAGWDVGAGHGERPDGGHRMHGGFGEGSGASSELERAVALLNQRFPSGPAVRRDRERAFGVLARKGYESETAADAVREWARRATV